MKDFVFVSGNMYKVAALEACLGSKFEHHKLDLEELQSYDPHKVAQHKAREAYKKLQKPVLVDDVSLGYQAMKGLPGTLVKSFLDAIGPEGLAKMLDGFEDRSAVATVVLAYYDGKDMQIFEGITEGKITKKPQGLKNTPFGHGWNSIFMPEGQNKTFAEMNNAEVSDFSSRSKAVKKLKVFLES